MCGGTSRLRCPRCRRPLCDAHSPIDEAHCCSVCESEYRPLSPKNLLVRAFVVATGTVLGGVGGLCFGLVLGTLVFLGDTAPARVVAMTAAMLGTAIGFGAANVLADATLRACFLEQAPPGVPTARALRGSARRPSLAGARSQRRLMDCSRRATLTVERWKHPVPHHPR